MKIYFYYALKYISLMNLITQLKRLQKIQNFLKRWFY